ncbi:ribbon-helix-helix protein, CopG family [Bradyrhizobium sp. McL0616]|uniref:ribbon-helix-helix protein, CopG family n=1 Tax=Bradyrhizobium sp. McL0616 TaxID=3415674 RepID=UPI003CEE17A3
MDPVSAVRLPADVTAEVDAWGEARELSRSEAIRRLVEIGLGKSVPAVAVTSPAKGSAERAKQLAGKTIDGMVEPAASAEEKAVRKRRLIKGPEEFRGSRIDRARTKDK